MKGMGVLELMTVLTLKRMRRPGSGAPYASSPSRTKRRAAIYGAEWLDKEHPEVLDGAFVINEGGYGATGYLGVERPLFGISMAEKSPLWLTLRATGRPGHGSAPHDDNVLDRMVRAMQRIQAWQRPYVMTDPVQGCPARRSRRGLHRRQPGQDAGRRQSPIAIARCAPS